MARIIEKFLEKAEHFRRLKEGTTDDLKRSHFEEMERSYHLLAESERLAAVASMHNAA
jgi:hypothetical protein